MDFTNDSYLTLAAPAYGEFRDRGSKFLAYAFPISETEAVAEHLQQLRQEHLKARHYCYAYRIGLDKNNFRANDDGEPSNSAGRPILGQIDSAGLTNTLVVVVRYFGGTKLGVPGLINAYKSSTAAALDSAQIVERHLRQYYRLSFTYAHMNKLMQAINALGFTMHQQEFTDSSAQVEVSIRWREAAPALRQLKATMAGVYLEQVDELEEIVGLQIEELALK
ncbi:MAG: YigZ family protein [Bacteroidetes bacterium]|nr:MAG: YigZ family protein [Bacteroidota bacterium]